jgi:hypothetical protein
MWTHDSPPPRQDDFVYSKTHCPLSFDVINVNTIKQKPPQSGKAAGIEAEQHTQSSVVTSYASALPTSTESVLLLDVSARVSCKDLQFAHSVWRSGKSALVGFFPRLHAPPAITTTTTTTTTSENAPAPAPAVAVGGYTFYGKYHVWWNSVYSIMLPAGAFADTQLLQRSASSSPLQAVLAAHPECYHVGLAMWAAANANANDGQSQSSRPPPPAPPVWAKVPISATIDADAISAEAHGRCMDLLDAALNLNQQQQRRLPLLPYSFTKSVRASQLWFW